MATLRARTVFADETLTVTAIESLEFRDIGVDHWRHVAGSLRPVAVIVKEPDGTRALDMNAAPLDMDEMDLPADFKLE